MSEVDPKTMQAAQKNYRKFVKVERIKDGLIMMVPEGAAEAKHFRLVKDTTTGQEVEKNLLDARIAAGLVDVPAPAAPADPVESMPDAEDPEAGMVDLTEETAKIAAEEDYTVPAPAAAHIAAPVEVPEAVPAAAAPVAIPYITLEEAKALDYQELRAKAREYKPELKGQNKKQLLLDIVTGKPVDIN